MQNKHTTYTAKYTAEMVLQAYDLATIGDKHLKKVAKH